MPNNRSQPRVSSDAASTLVATRGLADFNATAQVYLGCTQCGQVVIRLDAERSDTVRPIGWFRRCEHIDEPWQHLTPSLAEQVATELIADARLTPALIQEALPL
jgi:hypothetical protein